MMVAEQKRAFRRDMRARVDAFCAGDKSEASAAVCARLSALEAFGSAGTVFCFVGTARELDTMPFLERALGAGKRLCVPLCVSSGVMELRQLNALAQLRAGAYGIMEPPRNAPLVSAAEVDFAVIPCLSCNREGQRLGKGGGYYDRFLAEYGGFAVLVCPEALLNEHIPTEPHDRAVAHVLTESAYYERGHALDIHLPQLVQKPLRGL